MQTITTIGFDIAKSGVDAVAIFAVAAHAVFFLAAFALPETRGRVLNAEV
jgi:hypothetical protein